MATDKSSKSTTDSSANLGFEAKLWLSADTAPRVSANRYGVAIHHLAPHGMAGFILANGSMSSKQSSEGDIRQYDQFLRQERVNKLVEQPSTKLAATVESY